MQSVIYYNTPVVLEFMITKIHFNKRGVKFRLEDEVQNTTYMIIAEN